MAAFMDFKSYSNLLHLENELFQRQIDRMIYNSSEPNQLNFTSSNCNNIRLDWIQDEKFKYFSSFKFIIIMFKYFMFEIISMFFFWREKCAKQQSYARDNKLQV